MPRGLPHVALTRLTALSLLPPLLEAAGLDSHELILARDAHWRPHAVNAPELDFNLSHSDAHAVCALLLGGGRVGIDVEEPLAPDRAPRLMQRYSTDGERTLFDVADPRPWEGFVRLWTLREAMAKQDGRGQPLNFDASAVHPNVCAYCGHLPDTGAALALCIPNAISLTDLRTLSCSLPIAWDNTL
jgi:phosphopantetheinyl transferase